jgi:ABC-2 type transport system ATP-binding protein
VVLSSHLITDLAQICDYLIVLVASTVRVAGRIDELLAAHHRLTGPAAAPVPAGVTVIESAPPPSRPTPQTPGPEPRATVLARGPVPAPGQGWTCSPASLDDLVLAYLGGPSGQRPTGVVR